MNKEYDFFEELTKVSIEGIKAIYHEPPDGYEYTGIYGLVNGEWVPVARKINEDVTFDPHVDSDAYMEKVKNINTKQFTGSFEVSKTSSVWCNMYDEYYESYNKTCQKCHANNECIKNKINKRFNR